MKLVGIRIKNRLWFYLIILFIHSLYFLVSYEIPTPVEALILLTIYLIMFSDSIILKYAKDEVSE